MTDEKKLVETAAWTYEVGVAAGMRLAAEIVDDLMLERAKAHMKPAIDSECAIAIRQALARGLK